jgi:hypothetical protein
MAEVVCPMSLAASREFSTPEFFDTVRVYIPRTVLALKVRVTLRKAAVPMNRHGSIEPCAWKISSHLPASQLASFYARTPSKPWSHFDYGTAAEPIAFKRLYFSLVFTHHDKLRDDLRFSQLGLLD